MSEQFEYTYKDPDGDLLRFEENGEYIVADSVDTSDNSRVRVVVLPSERREAAAALAGPDYRVVPAKDYELTTDAALEQAHADLRAILDALGLSTASRPYSPHECVQRDVLPAIQLIQERNRHLSTALAGEQPDRPEPVDPASVRVGDVVEIEGDDWMVRTRVADTDDPSHDGPPYPQDSPFGIKLDRFYWWPKIADATVRILHAAEPEPDEAAVEALKRALRAVDRSGLPSDDEWIERRAVELIRDHGVRVEVPADERTGRPMTDRRFHAWPALGVDPSRAVQIIRDYDGRIFAMSVDEARQLVTQIEKAADQAESRRHA